MSSFQLPSAKNLTIAKTVDAFVPTRLYWEILDSDSNDIVFGTRGSGKTMLLRMMSVPHLVEFAKRSQDAELALLTKKRFGIFLPLGIDWCVALTRQSQDDGLLFTEGVNLAATLAFVETLSVVVHSVLEVPLLEATLVARLLSQWFRSIPQAVSFYDLRHVLLREQALLRDRSRGDGGHVVDKDRAFLSGSLFAPVIDGVRVANDVLGLEGDHRWLLCVDELEGLRPNQMRLVGTLLRSSTAPVVFKITTLPYTFESNETDFSEAASAVDFRDYEIKRLQYDPGDADFRTLASGILQKRLAPRGEIVPANVFGDGEFADRAEATDPRFGKVRELISSRANRDSARKAIPVAAIRALKRAVTGNQNSIAYSGWTTITRLSDGNPGMFVRLLNALRPEDRPWPIPAHEQHRTVAELGTSWLEWSQALYEDGARLRELLVSVGNNFSRGLHDRTVADQEVREEANRFAVDLLQIPAKTAAAFKVAARHGLLVAEAQGTSLRYPTGGGVWRLSYALAPHFWLLPRRGRLGRGESGQLSFDFAVLADGIVEHDDASKVSEDI